MKTGNGIFGVTVLILFFSVAPAVLGFGAVQHIGEFDHDILMKKIYDDRWEIGYRFANTCPDEFRREEEKLKELITESMRVWLQPLRGEHLTAPIVDEFLFLPQKDFEGNKRLNKEDIRDLRKLDILITFKCESGFSYASTSSKEPPEVYMRQGLVVDAIFIHVLVHELGHAFGLLDTYVIPELPATASTGGLKRTKGKQPSGVMAGIPGADPPREPPDINEDDKRGIIWLYKYIYEGQPLEDCFFPEYVYEAEPPGCRPKHPLIFEIKYGQPLTRTWILDQDPTLDVNAQDENGLTALHYAVMYKQFEVAKTLLDREDINPLLLDKQGRSAFDLAWEKKFGDMNWWGTAIISVLESDPTLDINAQDANGMTLLHYAVTFNRPELVKGLLDHPTLDVKLLSHPKLDVNAQGRNGQTLLHHAVVLNRPELVKRLLAHPTLDVNAQDASGGTLLHHAVILNRPELVKGLLAHKDIKPYISDKSGNTPLALAQKRGLTSIVKLLTDHPRAFMAVEPRRKTMAIAWGELKRGN